MKYVMLSLIAAFIIMQFPCLDKSVSEFSDADDSSPVPVRG
ncbi:hypothetical protein C900_05846 [Fulvivirga imtechensis AK7]|uniref:Uncharacterized protein n=1 Tax=Fulvivirga imtechensis AK7 TaxID=1237149 RepID=L8JIY5_9BACT|nr:hypothetical protein C900_05846 [Fulvivirga imtechensis AK7]